MTSPTKELHAGEALPAADIAVYESIALLAKRAQQHVEKLEQARIQERANIEARINRLYNLAQITPPPISDEDIMNFKELLNKANNWRVVRVIRNYDLLFFFNTIELPFFSCSDDESTRAFEKLQLELDNINPIFILSELIEEDINIIRSGFSLIDADRIAQIMASAKGSKVTPEIAETAELKKIEFLILCEKALQGENTFNQAEISELARQNLSERKQQYAEKGYSLLQSFSERFQIPAEIYSQLDPESFYIAYYKMSASTIKRAVETNNLNDFIQEIIKINRKLLRKKLKASFEFQKVYDSYKQLYVIANYANVDPEQLLGMLSKKNLEESCDFRTKQLLDLIMPFSIR